MPNNIHNDVPVVVQQIIDDMRVRTKLWKPLSEAMGRAESTTRRRLQQQPWTFTLSDFLYAADLLGDGDAAAYLRRCLGTTEPAEARSQKSDRPDETDLMREFETLRERMSRRGFKLSLE